MPLPALSQGHAHELGVADVQLRLTPLEEVFLNVSRKAELEHAQVCIWMIAASVVNPELLLARHAFRAISRILAQAEGRFEMLALVEENVAIKVPVGAEFIQSPGRLLPCMRQHGGFA